MIPKLTLDGGLLRETEPRPAVQTLKKWETEGKLELFESDRAKDPKPASRATFGWPGAQPTRRPQSRFKPSGKGDLGGPVFQQMSAVLFPLRDPQRLNMNEINDVTHLLRHHTLGHTIFVTTNAQNFIVEGKRERLHSLFKILVLTPEETVVALGKPDPSGSSIKTKAAPK